MHNELTVINAYALDAVESVPVLMMIRSAPTNEHTKGKADRAAGLVSVPFQLKASLCGARADSAPWSKPDRFDTDAVMIC